MLVEIGLIVGAYVITRMFELLTKPSNERTVLVTICGVTTLLVAGLCVIDLVMRGLTTIN